MKRQSSHTMEQQKTARIEATHIAIQRLNAKNNRHRLWVIPYEVLDMEDLLSLTSCSGSAGDSLCVAQVEWRTTNELPTEKGELLAYLRSYKILVDEEGESQEHPVGEVPDNVYEDQLSMFPLADHGKWAIYETAYCEEKSNFHIEHFVTYSINTQRNWPTGSSLVEDSATNFVLIQREGETVADTEVWLVPEGFFSDGHHWTRINKNLLDLQDRISYLALEWKLCSSDDSMEEYDINQLRTYLAKKYELPSEEKLKRLFNCLFTGYERGLWSEYLFMNTNRSPLINVKMPRSCFITRIVTFRSTDLWR